MTLSRFVAVIAFCVSLPAWAEPPADALQWLQRVTAAAQKLTYTGIFVYQSGAQTETSRITHLVDGGDEMERIEVLDGSPREVVRVNDEVKCFLPENRLVIIERRGPSRQTFPALLPASLAGLSEHYTIRKGAASRVAGFDSQTIIVEPKDGLRYGRRFWIDKRSGLLLRAGLINELGEPLETFTFTELHIGGRIDRDALKPRPDAVRSEWKVHNVRTARGDDAQWNYHTHLPGFRKVTAMRRQVQADAPEMTHVVFSDGLAAISVFIEPLAGAGTDTGPFAMGAINAYKRVSGGHLLVAIGDVPVSSLKLLADGIEPRQK